MEKKARPGWDETWMGAAKLFAKRGTCLIRNYGAVIVSSQNKQISQGYTGQARGTPHCTDLKECMRKKLNVPPGQRYELCRGKHAEMNSIINAAFNGVRIPEKSKIYVCCLDHETGNVLSGKPCSLCKGAIINARIDEVIYSLPGNKIAKVKVADWVKEECKNPFGENPAAGKFLNLK